MKRGGDWQGRLLRRFSYLELARGRRSCAVLGQTEWIEAHVARVGLGGDPAAGWQRRRVWHAARLDALAPRLAARHGVVVCVGLPISPQLGAMLIMAPRLAGLTRARGTRPDMLRGHAGESLRSDLRRVREAGFTWVETRGAEQIEEFYHRFHEPTVRLRHGVEGFTYSVRELRQAMADGRHHFLRVMLGDEWVGGLMVEPRGEIYHLRRMGWREGREDLLQAGVVGATYLAAWEHATELGAGRMSFGAADPFWEDGLLRYKAKWGVELDRGESSETVLGWGIDPAHENGRRFWQERTLLAWGRETRWVAYGARAPEACARRATVRKGLAAWYRLRDEKGPDEGDLDREVPPRWRSWFVAEPWPSLG